MKHVLPLLAIAAFLAGCDGHIGVGKHVVGSGNRKTEVRQVSDFTAIELGGAIEATVTVGDKPSITLDADDNILPLVLTKSEGGVLRIYTEGSTSAKNPIKATVLVPKLHRVDISGASEVSISGLTTDQFYADLSGASTLVALGEAASVEIEASGASKADLGGVKSKTASINGSGASTIVLASPDKIMGQLSGASTLNHSGNPNVAIATSGASTVKQRS